MENVEAVGVRMRDLSALMVRPIERKAVVTVVTIKSTSHDLQHMVRSSMNEYGSNGIWCAFSVVWMSVNAMSWVRQ